MEKPRFRFLLVLLVLASVGGIFVLLRSQGQKNQVFSPVTPVVTPSPQHQTEVLSPDGKVTLRIKEEVGKEATTYTFSASSKAGGTREILTKSVSSSDAISVPYNTFSPDDKYIFLKETGSQTIYFAVPLTSTSPHTIDISGPFTAKYPDYKIADVTGWAGPTLVVVNAGKSDGGPGPSFWFDVSGKSFTQLSSRFN